jgi:hypothetical protein
MTRNVVIQAFQNLVLQVGMLGFCLLGGMRFLVAVCGFAAATSVLMPGFLFNLLSGL